MIIPGISGRFNGIQDIVIKHSLFEIWIPYASHSLNLVEKKVVEPSKVVLIFFAFIKNKIFDSTHLNIEYIYLFQILNLHHMKSSK